MKINHEGHEGHEDKKLFSSSPGEAGIMIDGPHFSRFPVSDPGVYHRKSVTLTFFSRVWVFDPGTCPFFLRTWVVDPVACLLFCVTSLVKTGTWMLIRVRRLLKSKYES
jgi:hypothetical protein